MRWEIAYSSGLVLGIFSLQQNQFCANALIDSFPVRQRRAATTTSSLNVGNLGWDNENFLEALGGNQDEREDANEKYYAQSRFGRDVPGAATPSDEPDDLPYKASSANSDEFSENRVDGAELTDEMKEKMRRAHDEEAQGGAMFKNLMERAKQAAASQPPRTRPQQPPAAAAPPSISPDNLSVEDQARMYRELMEQSQQGAPPPPADPYREYEPPPPPAAKQPFGNAVSTDGRRVGRNRDADAIVNTADVYFAQLKRDSKVRNIARYSGNEELANKVFQDPAIKEIKMAVNPYQEELRAKEKAMVDTAADEMLELGMTQEIRTPAPKGYAGVNYKDRLQKIKGSKGGNAATSMTDAVVEAPAASPAPTAPPAQQQQQHPPAVVEATVAPQEAAPEPVSPPPVEPLVQSQTPEAAAATEDTMRVDIRKLMGTLLKHRGGSGFGAGRLRGEDIRNFEQLAMDLAAILRDEARNRPGVEQPAFFEQMASVASTQQTVTPSAAVSTEAMVQIPSQPTGGRVNSMIACIEGAILMYKNSPPELKEGILATLRAALLSAVNSCNEIIGDEVPNLQAQQTTTSQPIGDRINSMNAVIEGAVQMYKNSPPELHGPVLVTLRAALLSAVSTLNSIIANNEVANVQAYQTATASVQAPLPSAPVVATPVAPEQVASSYSGTDANSQVLKKVYQKLQAAAGEGKMGLRADLSPSDALELADDIAEMRAMLVNELDGGIPEDSSGSVTASAAPSDTGSKYQEMLAKARADKEAKNN
jgi:hypothetical protein